MTTPSSRREAMEKARQSRRPSRLGAPAGSAPGPDHARDPGAGFAALLGSVWRTAEQAAQLHRTVDTVLTLDGRVPADVSLRALATPAACAVEALWGASWRGSHRCRPTQYDGTNAFVGEIGLGTDGRLRVRTPSDPPLDRTSLAGRPARVPWPASVLARYADSLAHARARNAAAVEDCRAWLGRHTEDERTEMLDALQTATLHTAPFVLYQEGRAYTNFRDRNTIVGKTLWPGHPDCTLSNLKGLPLRLWSDEDAVMVVCLTLLLRSGSAGRIEEANGTELNPDTVGHLLERVRQAYHTVDAGESIPRVAYSGVEALDDLARGLAAKRAEVAKVRQLYREIHGVLLHKVERVAAGTSPGAWEREAELVDRLCDRLPIAGRSLEELGTALRTTPGWLTDPAGEFGTGLESLVYESVTAAMEVFAADFAMSRGMRDLSGFIDALRRDDLSRIVAWELPDYFCCVVPSPDADRHYPGGTPQVADVAWAISSRMQYNSWHFVPGNLPPAAGELRHDYFIPPTMPDLAYHSDQHHHGHVTARVRYTVRSPQPVEILGRTFKGFIDLRLLRCDGEPFTEADLLAAHRLSRFVARATGLVADLAATGTRFRVTAFDSQWHWSTILAAASAATSGGTRR